MKKIKGISLFIIFVLFSGIAQAGLFDGMILQKANKYYQEGKYNEAMIEYQNLRDASPENPMSYYGMGSIWYAVGNYEMALNRFQIAIQLEPKFLLAYLWAGNTYWKIGKKDKAIQYWKECLKIDPKNESAKSNIKEAQR